MMGRRVVIVGVGAAALVAAGWACASPYDGSTADDAAPDAAAAGDAVAPFA